MQSETQATARRRQIQIRSCRAVAAVGHLLFSIQPRGAHAMKRAMLCAWPLLALLLAPAQGESRCAWHGAVHVRGCRGCGREWARWILNAHKVVNRLASPSSSAMPIRPRPAFRLCRSPRRWESSGRHRRRTASTQASPQDIEKASSSSGAEEVASAAHPGVRLRCWLPRDSQASLCRGGGRKSLQ